MRLKGGILAPGLVLEPSDGTPTKFQSATFRGLDGHEVQGFSAELIAEVRRDSRESVSDRAVVGAQGLLDLRLRCPLAEPQVTVSIGDKRIRRTQDISRLQSYEMGVILAGGPGLPRAELSVGPDTPQRIDLLWSH